MTFGDPQRGEAIVRLAGSRDSSGGPRRSLVRSTSIANEPGERVSASRGKSSEADAESILFAEA